MSTRIRLRRLGANKRPFYRVVVADQRSPRDGRFIENIGKYHPLEDPSLIEIDEERALHWLRVGAQPSNQVRVLMTRVGIWEKFVAGRSSAATPRPARERSGGGEKISKKAAANKAAEAAEAPAGSSIEEATSIEEDSPIEHTSVEAAVEEASPEAIVGAGADEATTEAAHDAEEPSGE